MKRSGSEVPAPTGIAGRDGLRVRVRTCARCIGAGWCRALAMAFVALAAVSCIEPLVLEADIAGDILAFEVAGQVRSSINTATRTVNVEVGEGVDLSRVLVERIELVETASCPVTEGSVIDLSSPMTVTVTTIARYDWTVWATRAFDAGGERPLPGGDFEQWHRTDINGVLDPTGRVWNPWPVNGVWEQERWWDTGNRGVALLKPGNSAPTEPGEGCPAAPEGRAARLESIYAVIKVAGGNIYFGQFGEFTYPSLDATCHLGHNWQSKPSGLKGWYKYFPQRIDAVSDNHVALNPAGLSKQQWLGSSDSLHVCVALWASPDGRDIPFTVDTTPGSFVDFSRDQPGVLAYGAFVSAAEQAEWAEFDIEMEYFVDRDQPLPANTQLYLLVTASKNCNYFIAGTSGGGPDGTTGSLMYVDEMELVYD